MTKDEYNQWKTWRITGEIMEYGKRLANEYNELLIELNSGCTELEKVGLQGARLAGMIAGINAVLGIEWEDIENDSSSRV
jgi:hypothetical protein